MDLQKKDEATGVVSLWHTTGGELDFPKPFGRDIFLFDTHIAGVQHIPGFEELEPFLDLEEELEFYREPDNRYDSQAIRIQTKAGIKLGYVPQKDNIVFARLMDAGKWLIGKIIAKEKKGNWTKIQIGIYLKE